MGGTASVSHKETTEDVSRALVKVASKCQANAEAFIELRTGDVHGDFNIGGTFNQTASATATSCKQGAELNSLLQATLAQEISQSSKNNGFSLWGKSSSSTENINKTLSTMDMNTFQQCAPHSDAKFIQQAGTVFGSVNYAPRVTQDVVANVQTCVQNNKAIQQNVQTIVDHTNQSAQNGLTFDIFGPLVTAAIVLGAAGVGGAVIYNQSNKKGSAATK